MVDVSYYMSSTGILMDLRGNPVLSAEDWRILIPHHFAELRQLRVDRIYRTIVCQPQHFWHLLYSEFPSWTEKYTRNTSADVMISHFWKTLHAWLAVLLPKRLQGPKRALTQTLNTIFVYRLIFWNEMLMHGSNSDARCISSYGKYVVFGMGWARMTRLIKSDLVLLNADYKSSIRIKYFCLS